MKKGEVAQLVELHLEEMMRWTLSKTSSLHVAEDIVQDTFLAAAEKIGTYRGESSHKTWLFSILNNKITDYYHKKLHQPVLSESTSFSDFFGETDAWQKNKKPGNWQEDDNMLDDDDFRKILQHCLEALPETWNICVKLKYLSGKKGEQICQEVGITPSNFWQIIHRAKLQLRECVDVKWFKI